MHTFSGFSFSVISKLQQAAWMKSLNNFDQIQLHKKSEKFIHNMMDKYVNSNEARNFDIPNMTMVTNKQERCLVQIIIIHHLYRCNKS